MTVQHRPGCCGAPGLASEAAAGALADADVDPESVGLVVVATSSPDDLFGDATSIAHAIGAKNAVAFDMTAACRSLSVCAPLGCDPPPRCLSRIPNPDNTSNYARACYRGSCRSIILLCATPTPCSLIYFSNFPTGPACRC